MTTPEPEWIIRRPAAVQPLRRSRERRGSPYRDGCLRFRDRLLAPGRRHGTGPLRGASFAFSGLPWLPVSGPVLETAALVAPRLGATWTLTVRRGTPR
jgi:hypothetical protein